MRTIENKKLLQRQAHNLAAVRILLLSVAIVSVCVLVWTLATYTASIPIIVITFIAFTICISAGIWILINPESIRAKQTEVMLRISNSMVDLMVDGMTPEAAQRICELLLPRTSAIAVAITDRSQILGYAGYREAFNPQGAEIRTQATHDVLTDGSARILYKPEDIGLPEGAKLIKAAIIVPIEVSGEIVGTLKFYYEEANDITDTQKSIAQGLGKLLATEVAATRLEEQRELATSMELKMLQSQINPHFLFNTINTIASLIRTDPPVARELLREFAVFYRSTLENAQDQIALETELAQTLRYFRFEVARFGEDRLAMEVDLESGTSGSDFDVTQMMVPPFLVQPIVENAVKHAMPESGKLIVSIYAEIEGSDVLLHVEDNGVGMDEEACKNIMNAQSSTGLGIAVKNVSDRMHGFYGPDAGMIVKSTLGVGSTVTLLFPHIVE